MIKSKEAITKSKLLELLWNIHDESIDFHNSFDKELNRSFRKLEVEINDLREDIRKTSGINDNKCKLAVIM